MKNLIISTFLILSTLATGLMSYQPGEITNMLGGIQASAQNKDAKRCDAATAGFYGEFVVTSANVSVVERDGKAGTALPQATLVEAIKYSGLYRDMFTANASADTIIAKAVSDRACVISPINYVSVVTMDTSDKQYYSPTFLTYCGIGYTTVGNTFTKVNGTQTADTLGYGAFLTTQCKAIPLVCKDGEIKTVVDGKEVCQTKPADCKQYYYKPTGTTVCVPVTCLAPATFVEDKGCVTPPPVCVAPTTGTYPTCVLPPLVCVAPSVLNPTTKVCETTITNIVCTPPAILNSTKTGCDLPPVVCTAPAVLNPTTKVCETPAAPAEQKKSGSMLPIFLGGVALVAGCIFLFCKGKKPATPGTPNTPGTPPTPPTTKIATVCTKENQAWVYKSKDAAFRAKAAAISANFKSAGVYTGLKANLGKFVLRCGRPTTPNTPPKPPVPPKTIKPTSCRMLSTEAIAKIRSTGAEPTKLGGIWYTYPKGKTTERTALSYTRAAQTFGLKVNPSASTGTADCFLDKVAG